MNGAKLLDRLTQGDVRRVASGAALSRGALTVADGEGIAWTEMARGLLVHWIRLEPGPRQADTARAARYHVVAPTEWNFHPEGGLARWLASTRAPIARVQLAAATLDPCIAFRIDEVAGHA